MSDFHRYEGESELSLTYRVGSQKEAIGTWSDVAEILNDLTGKEYTESKWRKDYKLIQDFLDEHRESVADSDEQIKQLRDEQHRLRMEKQKLFDERTALNKKLRDHARLEQDLSYLEDMIRENGRTTFLPMQPVERHSSNDLIICLSDLHLGLNVSSQFGDFNSEIAEERMSKYLDEIVVACEMYNTENAYVFMLGDLLSGNIHPTVQLENRENVVEQVQKAGELISLFLYELSNHFQIVYVNGVAGNHSRLSYKDQVLRGERLDNLIPWYLKAKLSHLSNVVFIDDENTDATIGTANIRGNEYVLVHGDFDGYSESGISKLVMMIGYKPEAIFYGHLHHCSYDDISNVKIIRSGSFCGACDNYTISKRILGRASQMLCVVDNKGIHTVIPVVLE